MKDNSKIKDWIAGGLVLTTGLVAGMAAILLYKENKALHPSQVLDKVKHSLTSRGTVIQSWIDYNAIEYTLFDSLPEVYLGGVTLDQNGDLIYYHFAADVYTGDVIDLYEVNR